MSDPGPPEACGVCGGVDAHRADCVFVWAASVHYREGQDDDG